MGKNFLTATASRREVERNARKLVRAADWPREPKGAPLDDIEEYARSLITEAELTDGDLQAATVRIAEMEGMHAHSGKREELAHAAFHSAFDLSMALAATLGNVEKANNALNTETGDLNQAIADALTCTGLAGLFLARAVELKHSQKRSNGGHAKLAQDPNAAAIQASKCQAHEMWNDWRKRNDPRSNEQFAMECMQRWPVLKSAESILNWCTEWAKTDGS